MDVSKWRRNLEILTNLAVLISCVAVAALLIRSRTTASSYPPQGLASAIPSGIVRGDTFPAIAGVKYDATDRTLILALNTGCHFCQESVPFYKRLPSHATQTGTGTQIVAIFPNETDEARKFLTAGNLEFQVLGRQDFAKLGVEGTPTLVLLGRDGKVQKVWRGELSVSDQKKVLSAVASGTY